MMQASGYKRELLAEDKVVCYRFESLGTATADQWFVDVIELFENWDKHKPLLLLIDIRQPDNLLSAQAMMRARQVSQLRPDVPGKTAMLVDPSEPTQNVELLLDKVLSPTRERDTFSSEATAIAWLLT